MVAGAVGTAGELCVKNGRNRYVNLRDWIFFNSYAVFDGEGLEVLFFEREGQVVSNRQ